MNDSEFQIVLNGVTMNIQRINLPTHQAYRIEFSSARKPIIIARALNAELEKFWTSVPEGRQKEAEAIGKLIEQHLESNR